MAEKAVLIACQGACTLLLEQLESFQGDLKTLSEENAAKLRREILELGFSEPISVWQNDEHNYILNGHQRVLVLEKLRQDKYFIPPLPVSLVEAESFQQAKRKVLALTSQYGQVNMEGLEKVLKDAELEIEEALKRFTFPEVKLRPLEPLPEEDDSPYSGEYQVLVTDLTEEKQTALLEELVEREYSCRALLL